ncbi:MAG TPA: glutaminyl-peptide cyclotransferase [Bryobacteraceae bacterium]|nr:glutaminyl-peptide cyclotransferase [Bryobacteraceae bacterium]
MREMRIVCGLIASSITLAAQTPVYGYRVVHVYPHDPEAFTQGLEFRAGYLYEGTGLKGRSSLRKVKLETGQVLQQIDLPPEYFGEGITVINQQIIELTWQSQIGFVYNQASFQQLRSFNYPGEGWGLANDGQQIYMSDGTAAIRCWDPVTLEEKRRFTVRDRGKPVMNLNELEYVHGELYANVWQTDRIARISLRDGHVLSWVDLSGLLSDADRAGPVDVLNGIAYDVLGNRLFVTGKLWPKLFEIRIVPKSRAGK